MTMSDKRCAAAWGCLVLGAWLLNPALVRPTLAIGVVALGARLFAEDLRSC